MKKILLGTTALVGAALFANAASAEAPKVTLGGFSEFQAGIMSDDQDSQRRGHAFRSDNEISVKVDGKSDAGLGYGAEIWLEADVDADGSNIGSDQDDQGINASKTFVYLEGSWGRVEGGSNLGPDQTLKVDAASIARATGGIDGDWYYFANNCNANTTACASSHAFIATPDLPLNYGATGGGFTGGLGNESQENLNKLTYYTPKWNGFQGGLSYIPSDQERGQLTTAGSRVDNSGPLTVGAGANTTTISTADSIWVAGLNYTGQFDQIGIALAATGEWGEAEAATYEDLSAWQVGGKLSYMGFSIAGSYGDWDDSLRANGGSVDDNNYWTAGASYEYGPYGVSVTYLDSTFDVTSTTENEFTSWSVGADYKLAPGLTPYVEYTHYDQDANGTTSATDNDGDVFLVGTSLNF